MDDIAPPSPRAMRAFDIGMACLVLPFLAIAARLFL